MAKKFNNNKYNFNFSKYKTITTNNFWSIMQEAMDESKMPFNNFDIKLHLDGYISQVGYPIINVTRNYESGIIKLTQTSDRIDCKYFDCNVVHKKWWVPINFATMSNPNFSSSAATYWMEPKQKELTIDGVDPHDWYIINKQCVGNCFFSFFFNKSKNVQKYL